MNEILISKNRKTTLSSGSLIEIIEGEEEGRGRGGIGGSGGGGGVVSIGSIGIGGKVEGGGEEEEEENENKLAEILNEKFKILYDYTNNEEFIILMKKNLSEILEFIRFPILTPKELYNFVEPCKIGK